MNLRPQRPEPPDINLAPLIDVVFLLLIFFMVTTTFKDEAGLKIDLPEVQGEGVTRPRGLVLAIDGAGHYYVNDLPVADQGPVGLRLALQKAMASGRGEPRAEAVPLVLKADASTPYQAVVTAMDVASQLGLTHLSFAATRSPSPETAP